MFLNRHISVFILAALFSFAPSLLKAQDQRVVIPTGELNARAVFTEIEKQTDLMFIVRTSNFDVSKNIPVTAGETTVSAALAQVLEGTGKTWIKDGKYIIIPIEKSVEKPKTGIVAGIVYDHSGRDPLPAVAVEVVGSERRTATGRDGRFSFEGMSPGTYIVKFTEEGEPARYREVRVNAGHKTSVEMVFTQPDPETGVRPILQTLEANPVKPPVQRREPPVEVKKEVAAMPPAGTYTIVPVNEPARRYQPKTALKTNLLYWATTTPNVGLEFYLAPQWSFNTHFGYNAWKFSGQRGLLHWVVQPEARYWFCNVFERGFIGVHGIYGRYNIKDIKLPFTNAFVGYHYRGYAVGAGIAWGYHLPLGRRWGMEFSVGAGYVYLNYDKYRCGNCDRLEGNFSKNYFGPTKASVSLIFMIN